MDIRTFARLLGGVTYAPTSQACYVRVSIPRPDALPLSIKATFNGFDRRLLAKGTDVLVERTDPDNACKYRVTMVSVETAPSHYSFIGPTYCGDSDKSAVKGHVNSDKPAVKDYVRFVLPPLYYQVHRTQSGMYLNTCLKILWRAFRISSQEGERLMHNGNPYGGFTIVCRPDQFARFIVYRHAAGECINGVRDLKPELVPTDQAPDPYDQVSDQVSQETGISLGDVKTVLKTVGFAPGPGSNPVEVHVWNRNHPLVD